MEMEYNMVHTFETQHPQELIFGYSIFPVITLLFNMPWECTVCLLLNILMWSDFV